MTPVRWVITCSRILRISRLSDSGGGAGAGVLKPIAAKERKEHKEEKFSLRSLCSFVADQLSRAFVGLLISNREPCEREK